MICLRCGLVRASRCGCGRCGCSIAGGLVPLFPYIVLTRLHSAFLLSVTVTLLALFIFGYGKGRLTGSAPLRGAIQTLIIGALAAGAAFAIAKWIS